MDIETQEHLTQLRQSLAWRVHELQTEIHALEMERAGVSPGGDVVDTKDEADARQRADIDAQSVRIERAELRRCQEAIHRLDLGIYGDCCDCHQPIAMSRLRVMPEAERCGPCQTAHELRMHSSGTR